MYLMRATYPHQWREGQVVPILKPSKVSTNINSYRPITLICCLSKLMEKMVNRRLQLHLESNKILSTYQSGFRASHSTLDPLIRLEHSARSAILEGKFCIATFLDISQAFDNVWHYGLLSKLFSVGIPKKLANYIKNFLSLRKINVKVASSVSHSYPLHCGVGTTGICFEPHTFFTFYQ